MQKQENTTYLKAITIRDPSDLHSIKEDIKKGMVLILRVTPLAQKDVEKLRKVIDCLLYTSPSPRDLSTSRMPSSA